jgi:hypothetical protein
MIIHTHTLASKSAHHDLHHNIGMQEQVDRVEPGGHTGGHACGGGKKGQSHGAFSSPFRERTGWSLEAVFSGQAQGIEHATRQTARTATRRDKGDANARGAKEFRA